MTVLFAAIILSGEGESSTIWETYGYQTKSMLLANPPPPLHIPLFFSPLYKALALILFPVTYLLLNI